MVTVKIKKSVLLLLLKAKTLVEFVLRYCG